MRLVCPNCDAQYEVDERVIPDAGRDVQCSNCGHAWFQHPEGYEGETEPPLHAPGHAEDQPIPKPQNQAGGHVPEDTGQKPFDAEAETDAPVEHKADDGAEETESASVSTPGADDLQRRGLDDGVRDILREEAARETRVRKGEPESLETQEELGLPESPSARELRSVAAQERSARLRGLDVEEDASATRRDLLPDIEEINSTLSPIGSEDVVDDFAEPAARKSGFSRGFVLMLVCAALILGVYVYAPLIGEKAPALAPYLEDYVGLINKGREWVDDLIKLALSKV